MGANRIRMAFARGAAAVAMFVTLIALASCGDIGGSDDGGGDDGATVYGRVIDGTTRQPIGDADVILLVEGKKRELESSDSADPDKAGSFRFTDVPWGTHRLLVRADGYATVARTVTVKTLLEEMGTLAGGGTETIQLDDSDLDKLAPVDVGALALAKAVHLNVVVVNDEGTAVNGASVFAEADGLNAVCAKDDFGGNPVDLFADIGEYFETSAVTDANGLAALTGLHPCVNYTIVAPAMDLDGDGVYDYATTFNNTAYDAAVQNDDTLSLVLNDVDVNGPLTLTQVGSHGTVNTGWTNYNISDVGAAGITTNVGATATGTAAIGRNDSIKLIALFPVALNSGAFVMHHDNDLRNPDANDDGTADSDYNVETEISPASVSVDDSGTIITIAPPAGGWGLVNETVNLRGTVAPRFGGSTSLVTVDSAFYLANTDAAGDIRSVAATGPAADNYNSDGSAGAGNGAAAVYLEFPEYVEGAVMLLSYTTGGTTTVVDGSSTDIFTGGADSMVYTDSLTDSSKNCGNTVGQCGNGAGVYFRVNLATAAALPNLDDGDTVKLYLDVQDVEGNRLQGVYTLTVQ